MTDAQPDDDAFVAGLAAPPDPGWSQLFAIDFTWPTEAGNKREDELVPLTYRLGLVHSFEWMAWITPETYPNGVGLEAAELADVVRLTTSIVRGDGFVGGLLASRVADGTIPAAVERLRAAVTPR